MNRAQRRKAERTNRLCEHGYAKRLDRIGGHPYCPHGCGFPHSQRAQWGAADRRQR